jgi:hypothetical protein
MEWLPSKNQPTHPANPAMPKSAKFTGNNEWDNVGEAAGKHQLAMIS